MKLFVLILIFLLCLTSIFASNVGTAKVSVAVINNPPVITAMAIAPDAYEHTPLYCDAEFEDELKEINFRYKWYKNGVLISEEEVLNPSNFDAGDVVTCETIPNDFAQDGEAKTVSVEIKPQPFFSAITGAVVGVGEQAGFLNTFLFLVLVALVIFNVAYFFKRK